MDNHCASVRDKVVKEKKRLDNLYEQMKVIRFKDAFIMDERWSISRSRQIKSATW